MKVGILQFFSWPERRVAIETGPASRQGALGAVQSVYCRDPDGNLIEIASYLDR